MSMNSIADGAATFKLPTYTVTVPANKPVKDTAKTSVMAKVQENPAKPSDTVKVPAPVSVATEKPSRSMSHMVESYDSSGRAVTKFVDSGNNVIYQTPSEMVLKTQELMTNTQATANIKG
jgi:hypothetical protein